MSKKLPDHERVRIWNSFLHLARNETARLASHPGTAAVSTHAARGGGRLSDQEEAILASLAFSTLAVEARVNHLLEELFEKGRITRAVCDAALPLPPQHKWFILPRLAGRRRDVAEDRLPHRAVADICKRRNALVHVDFPRLSGTLPSPSEMVDLYRDFVNAMEDMNVVLGRVARHRKAVKALGQV